MKTLIKLAMGAAIAGAAVSLLMKKQRAAKALEGRGETADTAGPDSSYEQQPARGTSGFTLGELAAETSAPVVKNVLNS